MSGKVFNRVLFLMVLSTIPLQATVPFKYPGVYRADKLFNGANNSAATDSACMKPLQVIRSEWMPRQRPLTACFLGRETGDPF
jgi:hypothetical protein